MLSQALLALILTFLIQASKSHDVNCSSHQQCLDTIHRLSLVREEKEAKALKLLGLAKIAAEEASHFEDQSRRSLARAQKAEEDKARWDAKRKDLQMQLRLLENNISTSGEKEAEQELEKEAAAKIAAEQDQKHQKAVSATPVQERCLEDFASCTAGLIVLQVQQWMSLLHVFNRFYIAVACMALGALLLLLPSEGQAMVFAAVALVIVPFLVGGAFKDFLRLIGSPHWLLVTLAGLLTMAITLIFLWQGSDGLRLLVGAGLAILLGDLILVVSECFVTLPGFLVALAALGLGLVGAAAGLFRQGATQALAAAMPGALLAASGVLLLFSAAFPEAYLEDVAAALMPWAGSAGDKVLGRLFCECGRLLWLFLQVPALVHLLRTPGEAYNFPWQAELSKVAEASREQDLEQPLHSQEPHDETAEAAEMPEVARVSEVAEVAAERSEEEVPPAEAPPDFDPVATTQLLQRTVEALQALERTMPPRTGEMPTTHLAE